MHPLLVTPAEPIPLNKLNSLLESLLFQHSIWDTSSLCHFAAQFIQSSQCIPGAHILVCSNATLVIYDTGAYAILTHSPPTPQAPQASKPSPRTSHDR